MTIALAQAEMRRLQALRDLYVLDTPREERFDRITRFASSLFKAPMAVVSLVDAERQWFKSTCGIDATETGRDVAFCDHAIRGGPATVMVVPDATQDPRFSANPLVTGEPNIRFYAGATLSTAEGLCLGTLCIIDTVPRSSFSPEDAGRLAELAQLVTDELELSRTSHLATRRLQLLDMAEGLAGVGRWRFNAEDNRIDWSDEVYRIHGVDPASFDPNLDVAMNFYLEEDRDTVLGLLRQALETGEPYAFKMRLRHTSGDIRHVVCKAECDLWPDGGVRAIYGVFQDITEFETANATLSRAKKEAEAAARVKSEFLSNMSHELRTPLTSIVGFASLLTQETGLSPQGRRAVERVTGASEALLAVVNDILDFSKLEAGQLEIDRRPVDLCTVVAGAVELLEPQAAAKAVELACACLEPASAEHASHRVLLDDTRVRQILLNLVGNAVKFTRTGSVRVSACFDSESERLRCEIVDTGPGIPAEALGKLFQRFSQLDGSTSRAHGGSGLGLAICKGLVEAMGGAIGVESTLGEGSTFWFELPAPRFEEPVLLAADDGDAEPSLEGLRVLVTDDSPVNLELARLMLQAQGVAVTEASSGEEALRILAAQPFDLVLMDLRMPGLDGVATTQALRDRAGPNDITPVLAFTADTLVSGDPRLAGLFDGEIRKPIVPAVLVAEVRRWAQPMAAQGLAKAG